MPETETLPDSDTNSAPPSGAEPPPPGPSSEAPGSENGAGAAPSAPAGGGTLGEGGGGDDPDTTSTPANWPSNWRDIAAGGDDKTLQYLNRYASPVNVVKALMATRQKISSGEMLRARPEGEDEQALNEWRAQAGIPEKPEGYLDKLPDGLVVGEEDRPLVDGFISDMHEADAPPGVVHKALGWYYRLQEEQAAARAEADRSHRAQAEDNLRAEWGPEYRPNFNAIHGLFDTHGTDELKSRLFGARFPDGTPLGDDPEMLKFLVAVARDLNPGGVITAGDAKTASQNIEEEIAALEREMADTKARNSDYYKNEGKQARYRQLLEMRDKFEARKAS